MPSSNPPCATKLSANRLRSESRTASCGRPDAPLPDWPMFGGNASPPSETIDSWQSLQNDWFDLPPQGPKRAPMLNAPERCPALPMYASGTTTGTYDDFLTGQRQQPSEKPKPKKSLLFRPPEENCLESILRLRHDPLFLRKSLAEDLQRQVKRAYGGRPPESPEEHHMLLQTLFQAAAYHLNANRRMNYPELLVRSKNAAAGRHVDSTHEPDLTRLAMGTLTLRENESRAQAYFGEPSRADRDPGFCTVDGLCCEQIPTATGSFFEALFINFDAISRNIYGAMAKCILEGYSRVGVTTFEAIEDVLKTPGNQTFPDLDELTFEAPTLEPISIVAVSHLLPDVVPWLRSLCLRTEKFAIVPKQSTRLHPTAHDKFIARHLRSDLSREMLRDPEVARKLIDDLTPEGGDVLIVDHGGYFAPAFEAWRAKGDQPRVRGVIESTANGHARYAQVLRTAPLACPVLSVAHTTLKEAENIAVAEAIVQQTAKSMREQRLGVLAEKRDVAVIGYGAIGSRIAATLRADVHVRPWVYDVSPIKMLEARAAGCSIAASREDLLRRADVVFCATGAFSIANDVQADMLKDEAIVVAATSRDDEFKFYPHQFAFRDAEINNDPTLEAYPIATRNGIIYVLAGGQAINLVAGGTPGNYTAALQGAIAAQVHVFREKAQVPQAEAKIAEVDPSICETVAEIWHKEFYGPRRDTIEANLTAEMVRQGLFTPWSIHTDTMGHDDANIRDPEAPKTCVIQ